MMITVTEQSGTVLNKISWTCRLGSLRFLGRIRCAWLWALDDMAGKSKRWRLGGVTGGKWFVAPNEGGGWITRSQPTSTANLNRQLTTDNGVGARNIPMRFHLQFPWYGGYRMCQHENSRKQRAWIYKWMLCRWFERFFFDICQLPAICCVRVYTSDRLWNWSITKGNYLHKPKHWTCTISGYSLILSPPGWLQMYL